MALWDRVTQFLAIQPPEPLQVRADLAVGFDDFDSSILAIRRRQLRSQPWRQSSIREAMGVPAIFGAVTLVSNLVGSMSMKAMRREVELPPDERPRIIVRPDPFTIPREFYRATTYNIASRGEADWWIAKRDTDDSPLSLINMPPHEVKIEENPRDLLRPLVTWRDKLIPLDDFRQLVYAREPGELRGVGPLQLCGAAVSVSVESQEWAANTYSEGGKPSITIKSASELDATRQYDIDGNPGTDYSEADLLRIQWTDSPANVPRVIDPNIEEIKEYGGTSAASEMLSARDYQVGEIARMFHIPASLLEYAVAGSSLTYQNVGMEFEKLLRQCLRPDYMEAIEQTMSDLLTRSTVARFNSDALTLADIKTRYEVYGIGIDKGIISTEEAREFEGFTPGDVENAAVPFSPPQAIPTSLPIQARSAVEVRCTGTYTVVRQGVRSERVCNRKLGEGTPGSKLHCFRCKRDELVA
jgi:phage portal protein BeeE